MQCAGYRGAGRVAVDGFYPQATRCFYCKGRDITAANIRNYPVNTVPEHDLALIMALQRGLITYRHDVKNGEWRKAGRFCFFNRLIGNPTGSRLG